MNSFSEIVALPGSVPKIGHLEGFRSEIKPRKINNYCALVAGVLNEGS